MKARMFLVLRCTPAYTNMAFFFFPHMRKGMSRKKAWKFPLSLVGVFFFFFFRGGGGGGGGNLYLFRIFQSQNILGFWPVYVMSNGQKRTSGFVITYSY